MTDQNPRTAPRLPVTSPKVSDQGGDDVDQASRDSFPASDPPSWNGVRLGAPCPPFDEARHADGAGS